MNLLEWCWHQTLPASFATLQIIFEIDDCISVADKVVPIQAYFGIAIFAKSGWHGIIKIQGGMTEEWDFTSYQFLSSIFRTSRSYFLTTFVPGAIGSHRSVIMLQEYNSKPGWSLMYRSNPSNGEVQEGSLKQGREERNCSVSSWVKSNRVRAWEVTQCQVRTARHKAFLLHIPSHWEEPRSAFNCNHRTKFIPAIVLWSHGDPSHTSGQFESQHNKYVVQKHCDCILAPSHVNIQRQPSMWSQGELRQALHTFRTEMK